MYFLRDSLVDLTEDEWFAIAVIIAAIYHLTTTRTVCDLWNMRIRSGNFLALKFTNKLIAGEVL